MVVAIDRWLLPDTSGCVQKLVLVFGSGEESVVAVDNVRGQSNMVLVFRRLVKNEYLYVNVTKIIGNE
jgi:hypothetical protein